MLILQAGFRIRMEIPLHRGEISQPAGRHFVPGLTHLGKHRTISFIRQQVAGGLMLTHPLGEAREGRKVRQSKIQFEGGPLALHPSQSLLKEPGSASPTKSASR